MKKAQPKEQPAIDTVAAKPTYTIRMRYNDADHVVETNDLEEGLLSLSTPKLKTRVLFDLVDNSGKTCNKIIQCFEAKMIWRNKMARTVFLNRLILK